MSQVPHSPAQSYTYRVPSPPRILVPPPTLNSNGLPDLQIDQPGSFDLETNGFVNHEFLNKVTYGNFMTANNMLEWKYEQRRTAQQILPFLFLGPMGVAKDPAFLGQNGITMVLAVRNTRSAQAKLLGSRAAQELGLEAKSIDVAGNQELIAAFPRGIETINEHLSLKYQQHQAAGHQIGATNQTREIPPPGKVLVYCESGNERSASLVTAYIMAMYAMDLVKAIQIVQAQRFAIAFDDSLRNLLLTYESILRAKRDVVQAGTGTRDTDGSKMNGSSSGARESESKPKRALDDAYDDDMDMDAEGGQVDSARFEHREGNAPFRDRLWN